jgi:hypothetical protein
VRNLNRLQRRRGLGFVFSDGTAAPPDSTDAPSTGLTPVLYEDDPFAEIGYEADRLYEATLRNNARAGFFDSIVGSVSSLLRPRSAQVATAPRPAAAQTTPTDWLRENSTIVYGAAAVVVALAVIKAVRK